MICLATVLSLWKCHEFNCIHEMAMVPSDQRRKKKTRMSLVLRFPMFSGSAQSNWQATCPGKCRFQSIWCHRLSYIIWRATPMIVDIFRLTIPIFFSKLLLQGVDDSVSLRHISMYHSWWEKTLNHEHWMGLHKTCKVECIHAIKEHILTSNARFTSFTQPIHTWWDALFDSADLHPMSIVWALALWLAASDESWCIHGSVVPL